MDIISAHREVGTYRGAAVACGTESRSRSWSFPFPSLTSRSPAERPTEYSAESAVARHVKWLPRQGMERSLLRSVLILR